MTKIARLQKPHSCYILPELTERRAVGSSNKKAKRKEKKKRILIYEVYVTAIIHNAHFLRCYLRSRPSKLLNIRSQKTTDRSNLCITAREMPRTGRIQRKPTLSAAKPRYQEMPPQISSACILRKTQPAHGDATRAHLCTGGVYLLMASGLVSAIRARAPR